MIFFNSLSAIQPALATRISCILNQHSVIHKNILFLSETYGIVMEAVSLSRFKSALKRFLNIS